jgi:hypothetical protein
LAVGGLGPSGESRPKSSAGPILERMPYTKWTDIKSAKGAAGPRRPFLQVTYEPDLVGEGRVVTWLLRCEDLATQARSLPDGSIDFVNADVMFRDRAKLAGWTLDGIDLDFQPMPRA